MAFIVEWMIFFWSYRWKYLDCLDIMDAIIALSDKLYYFIDQRQFWWLVFQRKIGTVGL